MKSSQILKERVKTLEKLYFRDNSYTRYFTRLLKCGGKTRQWKSIKEVSVCWSDLLSVSSSAPEPAHQDVLPAEPAAVPASSQVRPQVPHP